MGSAWSYFGVTCKLPWATFEVTFGSLCVYDDGFGSLFGHLGSLWAHDAYMWELGRAI